MPRTVRALGLLAIVAFVPFPLAAQGTPPAPRDTAAQRIEPTEIRGQRGATIVGGASASVVRIDSVRTSISPSLADILRTVPLVLVRTNSRGEVELSVRGSESRQVGIMLNGLPLSPGWDGRADPSLIPMTGISQLSYVRATSSVLGGPNTLGGVIDLQVDSPALGYDPRLSVGSDETGAQLFSGGLGRSSRTASGGLFTWKVGGGLRDIDGIVRAKDVPDLAPSGDLRTNTDLSSRDGFASIGYRATSGAGVSALVTGYDAERGVAPELHADEPRFWRYPEQSRLASQLRLFAPTFRSRAGSTQLEVSGGLLNGTAHIETFTDATYATLDGTEDGKEQVMSARFAATQLLPNGAQVRMAVTSNTIRYDETLGTDPTSRYKQSLLSAGAETQWVLGSRTLVSGGLVFDRAETNEAGGKEPLAAKDHLGWRVGTTYMATTNTRLHASASSRSRFPALRELYSGALNRFEPNPALRPEELIAAELGVSFGDAMQSEGLVAQFIGFQHWLDDGIVRVGVPATNRFIRINRDETQVTGLEAMAGWKGGVNGPSITLDLVTQSVNIKDLTAGGAERKPEHMPNFRAMLDGTIPVVAQIRLGANLAHVGNQYCVDPDTDADTPLDAQTIGGVTVERSWRLGSGRGFGLMRVLAGMDNITNAAVYEQCGLPRAGRTLRIGVDLR
jgi:iron complex outermembrane receptor protein